MIDGVTSQPFSAATLPFNEPEDSFAEEIIKSSQSKYGRLRKNVEGEILMRYQQTEPVDQMEKQHESNQKRLF